MGTQGSFTLGCGSVDSKVQIYYIAEDEYGSSIKSIDQNSVRIKEDSNQVPNLKRVGKRFKYEFCNWIFLDLNEMNDVYIMTVPKETIISEYNIDFKS